jgi:hypothetical protein
LDGNPRIIGGVVDMGAYENQDPVSAPFISWLQGFGLATDGSESFTDKDGDGLSNWQEWITGTVPTDPMSVLRLNAPVRTSQGLTLSWRSVAGKTYFLERADTSAGAFQIIQSNISGQAGVTSVNDENTAAKGQLFYRVGIQQ